MKIKIILAVLVTVMLALSSCGGKMSDRGYNEMVVSMHTKSWDYLNPRMEKIYAHEISKEDAQLLIDSLTMKYDNNVKYLKEIEISDEAQDYNNACIHLFEYTRDSVIPLYKETLNFEPESKQWYGVWNEIDRRLKGRSVQLEKRMMDEQKKFASSVGERLR